MITGDHWAGCLGVTCAAPADGPFGSTATTAGPGPSLESRHATPPILCRMRLLASEPKLRSVDAAVAAGILCAAGSAVVNHFTGWGCPFNAATGWWCPFCGGTRSIQALAHGRCDSALQSNGLVILVLTFVVARLVLRFSGNGLRLQKIDRWIGRVDLRVWAVALVTWTIVRNLPGLHLLGPLVGP